MPLTDSMAASAGLAAITQHPGWILFTFSDLCPVVTMVVAMITICTFCKNNHIYINAEQVICLYIIQDKIYKLFIQDGQKKYGKLHLLHILFNYSISTT